MFITNQSRVAKLTLSYAFTLSNRLSEKAAQLIGNDAQSLAYWVANGSKSEISANNSRRRLCVYELMDLGERMIKLRYDIRNSLNQKNQELGISEKLVEINEKKDILNQLKYLIPNAIYVPADKVKETNSDEVQYLTCLDSKMIEQISSQVESLEMDICEIREEINKVNHTEFIEVYIDQDIIDMMGVKNYK